MIRRQLRRDGAMPFSRYMEYALYQPGLGYYSGGAAIFRQDGDYITAPELSPLFAQALSAQVGELLRLMPEPCILEAGAGRGVLAADLLAALETAGRLPEKYLLLELSADLRERQRETLRRRVPHLLDRVAWLDRLPTGKLRGLILANELLDAMPVDLFDMRDGVARELLVDWRDGFVLYPGAALPERIQQRLRPLALADGYRSECNQRAEAWVATMADLLHTGALLLIDYGFPRNEYYHPQRSEGTLMCHYRHRAHDDPLVLTGLQDITAHIDFTAMAEAGTEAGLSLAGFLPQAEFLLNCGIMDWVTDTANNPASASALKRLLLPGEMGELFKVIAFQKGLDASLRGFARGDRRYRL